MRIHFKINARNFLFLFLLIATLAENKFLGLLDINDDVRNGIEFGAVILSMLTVFFSKNFFGVEKTVGYQKQYIIGIVVFLLGQFCYVMSKYGNDAINGFVDAAKRYFWVVLIIPFFYIQKKDGGPEKILDMFANIVVITSVAILIAVVLYNYSHISIYIINMWGKIHMRKGRVRLWDLSSLKSLAAIWLFFKILNYRKRRILNTIKLIIILILVFYVEQTRMSELAILGSMALMFATSNNRNRHVFLVRFLVGILAVIVIGASGYVGKFIQSFSTTAGGEYAGSSIVRLQEIEYCIGLIKENPINGTGLVTSSIRNLYYNYTGRGILAYSDIGLIGLLAQVGLWSVLIYIIPLIRMAYILIRTKEKHTQIFYFHLSNFAFLLMTSTTLIVLDQPRFYAWPVYIALFEYFYYSSKADGSYDQGFISNSLEYRYSRVIG